MENKDQKEKIYEEFYKYIGSIHAENTAREADDIIEKSKDLDFPEELDHWFKGYLGEAIKKDKKNKFKSSFISIAKRAAIIFIVLAIGGFATTMSVEAYRIRFFNLVTEVTERYTSFSLEEESDKITSSNIILEKSFFYPTYIPIGYIESDAQSYGELRVVYFENDNGDKIEFLQSGLNSDFQLDTEDAITEDITINGYKGFLVSKEGLKTLLWFTDTNSFLLMGKLDQQEIVSMAESLAFIK
ncbi:MAG: DUF4367 domain-containing protein [Gudongella sp.]|nr:DUF4367 domain-containing protein [Gudongella sp.]